MFHKQITRREKKQVVTNSRTSPAKTSENNSKDASILNPTPPAIQIEVKDEIKKEEKSNLNNTQKLNTSLTPKSDLNSMLHFPTFTSKFKKISIYERKEDIYRLLSPKSPLNLDSFPRANPEKSTQTNQAKLNLILRLPKNSPDLVSKIKNNFNKIQSEGKLDLKKSISNIKQNEKAEKEKKLQEIFTDSKIEVREKNQSSIHHLGCYTTPNSKRPQSRLSQSSCHLIKKLSTSRPQSGINRISKPILFNDDFIIERIVPPKDHKDHNNDHRSSVTEEIVAKRRRSIEIEERILQSRKTTIKKKIDQEQLEKVLHWHQPGDTMVQFNIIQNNQNSSLKGRAAQEIENEIKRINDNLNINLSKLAKDGMINQIRSPKILSNMDLETLKHELKLKMTKPDQANFERMRNVVSKLSFFININDSVKTSILKSAYLVNVPANSMVMKDGDYSDLIYIILRGSVVIKIHDGTTGRNNKKSAVQGFMTDGNHFSKHTLINAQRDYNYSQVVSSRKLLTIKRMQSFERFESLETAKSLNKVASTLEKIDQEKEERKVSVPGSSTLENQIKDNSSESDSDDFTTTATVESLEDSYFLLVPRLKFKTVLQDMVQSDINYRIRVLKMLPYFKMMDSYELIPLARSLESRIYNYGDIIVSAGQKLKKFRIISEGRCKSILAVKKNKPKRRPLTALTSHKPEAEKVRTLMREDENFDYLQFSVLSIGDGFGGKYFLHNEKLAKTNLTEDDARAKLSIVSDSKLTEMLDLKTDAFLSLPVALRDLLKTHFINSKEYDEYDFENGMQFIDEWRKSTQSIQLKEYFE